MRRYYIQFRDGTVSTPPPGAVVRVQTNGWLLVDARFVSDASLRDERWYPPQAILCVTSISPAINFEEDV